MAEVNILDLTNLAKDLDQAATKSGDAVQRLLELAGNEIAAEAQNLAPVRTGALRDSIAVSVIGVHRVYVGPDVPYSSFVEYGTRGPYEIRPKNARVLKFRVGGQTVFARRVTHPGIKAQPYMRPAAQQWVDSLGSRAAQVGVNLIMGREDVSSDGG